MDAPHWVTLVGVVTIAGVLVGILKFILVSIDSRIEEKAEECVDKAIRPIMKQLTIISTQLNNGVLLEFRKQVEAVQRLEVTTATLSTNVNNLTRQIEEEHHERRLG